MRIGSTGQHTTIYISVDMGISLDQTDKFNQWRTSPLSTECRNLYIILIGNWQANENELMNFSEIWRTLETVILELPIENLTLYHEHLDGLPLVLWRSLCNTIRGGNHIKKLTIGKQFFSQERNEKLSELCVLLTQYQHLTQLTLEDNNLHEISEGNWDLFCVALAASRLRLLKLGNNQLGEIPFPIWKSLCISIRTSQIEVIDLSNNALIGNNFDNQLERWQFFWKELALPETVNCVRVVNFKGNHFQWRDIEESWLSQLTRTKCYRLILGAEPHDRELIIENPLLQRLSMILQKNALFHDPKQLNKANQQNVICIYILYCQAYCQPESKLTKLPSSIFLVILSFITPPTVNHTRQNELYDRIFKNMETRHARHAAVNARLAVSARLKIAQTMSTTPIPKQDSVPFKWQAHDAHGKKLLQTHPLQGNIERGAMLMFLQEKIKRAASAEALLNVYHEVTDLRRLYPIHLERNFFKCGHEGNTKTYQHFKRCLQERTSEIKEAETSNISEIRARETLDQLLADLSKVRDQARELSSPEEKHEEKAPSNNHICLLL